MLCVKFTPKSTPKLIVKYSLEKAPCYALKFYLKLLTRKTPMLSVKFLPKRPSCYVN